MLIRPSLDRHSRRQLFPLLLLGPLMSISPMAIAQEETDIPSLGENAKGDLRIAHAIWARYDGGPPLAAPITFDAGEQAFFRGRVAGMRLTEVEFKRYRIFLRYEIRAYDFRGNPLGEPTKDVINESIHVEDKDWLPTIRHNVNIPPLAENGDYELRITVSDEASQRSGQFTQRFHVDGKQLPALDKISVINFGFYRAENEKSPMPQGVYRPGNALWARFDLAGFQLGDGNHLDVSCDIQVRDATGKILMEQPDALQEDLFPSYPQRYVPGVFSLVVQPGTRAGNYSIVVIAKDRLKNTTEEYSFPFSVD